MMRAAHPRPDSPSPTGGLVVAVAGRRVDAADAPVARFPFASADAVADRVRAFLAGRRADTVVASAACGADLLALEAAGELGLRRVVVLPFDRRRFRESSVVDRPGGAERWGPLFDRVLAEIAAQDLLTLDEHGTDEAYVATNERILDEALRLAGASSGQASAMIVWDGASRGPEDITARFAQSARRRGMPVDEILTR